MRLAKDEPVAESSKRKQATAGPDDVPEDERRVRAAIDKHLKAKAEAAEADSESHRPTGGPKQGFLPWLAQKLGLR